jgi:hypothetical protein
MLLLIVSCAGVGVMASMRKRSNPEYDEKGSVAKTDDWTKGGSAYTPDYSYSSSSPSTSGDASSSYTYSDPYAAPASAYPAPSYNASADYSTPASTAPSIADSSSTPPLWDFTVPPDRITELQDAIAADERALADLDDGATATGVIGLIGGFFENFSQREDVRDGGARTRNMAKDGVDFLAQQRAIIQARLDANRAELARLQGY